MRPVLTSSCAALATGAVVLVTTPALAAETSTRHLSDLTPTSSSNGWGPVERDRSNGELRAGDGRQLSVDGRTFAKGLGVHSTSDVRYAVPDGCTRFDAVVGVDDEVVHSGRVRFRVLRGGDQAYDSGDLRFDSAAANVSIGVSPGETLRLVVEDGGNGPHHDHADWADARFTCGAGTGTTPPAPPAPPAPSAPPAPPAQTGRDFGASRALWEPIGGGPRLDGNSWAIARRLAEPGASRVALMYSDGARILRADASTPRYRVNVTNAGTDRWGDNDLLHETVPIPDGAEAGPGSDAKLLVVDSSTRRVYDMWQARRNGGTWDVAWGGVYSLDGDGSSPNATYAQVPWPKPLTRGTGSGLSTLAGVAKASEIAAGVIPHALVFATDSACSAGNGGFRWPATATDGWTTSGTCIPEGARIQLDPSIDLAAIPGIGKGELAIGRALQTYGAYASDNGASRLSFALEAPSGANPYPEAGLLWDYYGLNRLPWGSLRVLASWDGA